MGLVFLTNDGDLANLMLKANLPQTYNLKLKTLLTFEEIENLVRATGAHIVRIKGKDAPWYEVTLSETRSDALRNRLFQTGHPVEKIKRVAIGNLALESLAPGHHRALSDAEVATLLRSVQPKPGVVTPRRMRVKRRPFTPKPKPSRKVKKPFVGAQDEGSLRPEHAHRAVLSSPRGSGNGTKNHPPSSDGVASKPRAPARPPRNRIENRRRNKFPRKGPHSRPEKPLRPTYA
jgi:hypothetical protein